MADGRIEKNDLVTQEAIDQITFLKKEITLLVGELSKLTKEQADVLNSMKKQTVSVSDLAIAEQKLQQEEIKTQNLRDKAIKQTEKLNSLWAQQRTELRNLENAAKEAAIKYGTLSNEFKDASEKVVTLKTKLDGINRSLGNGSQDVGKYERAMNGMKGALKDSLTSMIGWSAAIGGAIAGIKAAIGSAIEFDKALKGLSAITGLQGKDLSFMATKAKEFSAVTLQSSTEVLQAFTKIGSMQPILLKNKEALAEVTKQAIILSEASGGELGLENAALALSAAMNQFNLDASQAARTINVLSAGEVAGSATTNQLVASLKNVGAVANSAGMSLEQTVAALEVLAEKQLVGEEAGTKLRGSILKLQDAGKGYQSGSFQLKDALIEVNKELAAQGSNLERDALLQKYFGLENITGGRILLDNIDKYQQLTEAVTGTTSALDQQRIQNESAGAEWTKVANIFKNMFTSEGFSGGLAMAGKLVRVFIKEAIGSFEILYALFRNMAQNVTGIFRFDKIAKGTYLTQFSDNWKQMTISMGDALKNITNPLSETEAIAAKETEALKVKLEETKVLNQQVTEEKKKENDKRLKDEQKYQDDLKKISDQAAKNIREFELDKQKEDEAFEKQANQNIVDITKALNDQEITDLENQYIDRQITEEQYQLQREALVYDHLQRLRDTMVMFGVDTTEIDKQIQAARLAQATETNKKIDADDKKTQEAIKQRREEYARIMLDVSAQLGQALGEYYKSGRLDAKGFFKDIIQSSLKALKALTYVWIAQAVGGSMATIQSIATAGIAGGIQAAALTVAIEGAFSIAEAGVNSLMGFEKGTKHAPGGLAWVSEKGTEEMIYKGQSYLTPAHKSLMYIPKGAEIRPHDAIKNSLMRMQPLNETQMNNGLDTDRIVNAIIGKKSVTANITQDGIYIATQEGARTVHYIDNHYKC